MPILVQLVQLGGIGGALAFLLLGYLLLNTMVKQPINGLDARQLTLRSKQLGTVKALMGTALALFVAGAVFEIVEGGRTNKLMLHVSPGEIPEDVPKPEFTHNGNEVDTSKGEATIEVSHKDSLSLSADKLVSKLHDLQWTNRVKASQIASSTATNLATSEGGFSDAP